MAKQQLISEIVKLLNQFSEENLKNILSYLKHLQNAAKDRESLIKRETKETDISINLNLDGSGKFKISTGLRFFDHLLEQIPVHSGCNLFVNVKGDLDVDEHHTIEDTALALGEAFYSALGEKKGIERYGFVLPMDDCLAGVAVDFGGRSWIMWDVQFQREKIGDLPTEMIYHFFKSFCDTAKCNLNVRAEGQNEHHKAEAIFKCFAKAVKMAVKRDINNMILPSTKGKL
ncbi:MAG: imidazoleglycerol-phosphate dehydratase HisB [Bacteroidia bacterium]|nr:imidazoleglycerol-phosphate dehydratase HisB [Bacteroidia bacterium]